MGRSRSAEQTARVLLSSAIRHDTWECKALSDAVGGRLFTARFVWGEWPMAPELQYAIALHMTFYDRVKCAFVGATYTVLKDAPTEPLIFQNCGENVLLVVEVVARDERHNAPAEERRVLMWGYVPLTEVCTLHTIDLRPGSAQLLQLNSTSWPSNNRGETYYLKYTCVEVEDFVLTQLMSRLVPPGVIVPESFTENRPQCSTHSFRCAVRDIQLFPTLENPEWRDKSAEWRVAAVSHNGYQQLGQGAEVPLVFDDETFTSVSTTSNSNSISGSGSSESSNDFTQTSTSVYASVEKRKQQSTSIVHSVAPLEMDGLPVHSATSLVLAIRRRRMESQHFEVIGFCVFPLCVMPMKDRDLRVENLPILHGPFSCRDPRMLMLESSSPYGKQPFTLTLTVEYHDTLVVDTFPVSAPTSRHPLDKRELVKTGEKGADEKEFLAGAYDITQTFSSSTVVPGKIMGIVSTEELEEAKKATTEAATAPAVLGVTPTEHAATTTSPVKLTYPSPDALVAGKWATEDYSSVGVFKMLCDVMEELRRLREMQESAMRRRHQKDGLAGRGDETGKRLDDATGVEVVDLSPMPIAISWETRCLIEEDLQPILHPVHGTRLEDHALASSHDMTASLVGFRFEGLTADASIHVPEDVCFIFSFGSLPLQTIGPIRTVCIDKSNQLRTFKLYEGAERGGMVWCEPLEAAEDPFVQKYRQEKDATLHIHVYDALTMFYVSSVDVQLAHFRRPYNADSARIPMDIPLYRDLSLTERSIPPKVFPLVRNAGQLHVTLFCVAAKGGSAAQSRNKMLIPPSGSRVIVAKKLPHAKIIENHLLEGEKTDAGLKISVESGAAHPSDAVVTSQGPPQLSSSSSQQQPQQQLVPAASSTNEETSGMHWRRAQHVKQIYGNRTILPGVPNGHRFQDGDLEFRLRYLEKQRDEMKSRKIAEALMERLTAHHYVYVSSCRPEVTRTPFQNPFASAMQFTVEVDTPAKGALEIASSPSFYLGPREWTEVVLVVRLNAIANTRDAESKHLRARLFTDGREVVRIVDVHATLGPTFVDRRFEIYGPAGTEVSKKIFSRIFSSAIFPITSDRVKLLSRMRDMCARTTITSETTTAEVNAVLDPITQSFVTAWEEVTVRTTIPPDEREQRVEYLVLYKDDAMSHVIETWELCIFACHSVTSRELLFGQTTTVALPASGIEALYCSHSHVKVERGEGCYLLHVRPTEVGTQQVLLHALTNHHLAKTLLTIPTVYPTPTYTQTLEFSLADTTAPIFRRVQFVHRGTKEEVFTVRHNYKYQLRVTPKQFSLAPTDTQFITLQIDMLSLPEGQMEGRWPMWIFINNADDKTIESYLLNVVLRIHRVLHEVA
ncbi:dynein heavy chain, putative [Trypanosoma cruzi marinkellei]|uniref:Dynein heavy chain, putative n=1 Tax=Trypanosoma cruzi marinkellei TaxID=85056 RepID=K2NQE0_TRYCR|nr:dynein heavy chain, putative [Trypanosoma cruzi marinkellei]